MNLDQLIIEANLSYLNNLLSKAKEENKKGFDLFKYESKRQEDLEKRIKYYKDKGNLEKVKELEKQLKEYSFENAIKNYQKDDARDVNRIKNVNILKGKICFLMMDYVNLVSGVGLNGDFSTENAIKIVKTKKDEDGKTGFKVVGAPSMAEVTKRYNMLKKAVEQLKRYEYGYEYSGSGHTAGAPKKYFDDKQDRYVALSKALENVKPEDIGFELEDYSTPIATDANFVKTGKYTGKVNENGALEKYAEIKPLKIRNGKIVTRIDQTKIAKRIGNKNALGKARFNAFVWEELEPFIHEFQKYRKDYKTVNLDTMDADFVAKDVPTNLAARQAKISEYTNNKGKFSDFKKARKLEQKIGATSSAEARADDKGVDHSKFSAAKYASNLALRQTYGQSTTDGKASKTGNQGWLEVHHIEKINVTKVRKIIDGWISKGIEPNGQIKFFGAMPGSGGSTGAGTLIFMDTDNPAKDQFKYNGLYGFKAGKSFMNGDLTLAQEKYVENHAGRKADDWKKGVIEALKKYDTEGNATVYTEEVSYFNY